MNLGGANLLAYLIGLTIVIGSMALAAGVAVGLVWLVGRIVLWAMGE